MSFQETFSFYNYKFHFSNQYFLSFIEKKLISLDIVAKLFTLPIYDHFQIFPLSAVFLNHIILFNDY